jgi:hypothetical protein
MTPKPDNLPKNPADMTLSQVLQECARILHNAGGAERGAGDSADLANAALRWAENLPQWRPIESAPRDGTRCNIYRPGSLEWARVVFGQFSPDQFAKKPRPYWKHEREALTGTAEARANQPTHWYDFGHGQPMPPAPEGKP